jgi:PAS domain S-box-containing protein
MDASALDIAGAMRDDRGQLLFLADAGSRLSASLEPEALFALLARLSVPTLADQCSVTVLNGAGELHCVAAVHTETAKELLLRGLAQRWPTLWWEPELTAEVIERGAPVVLTATTAAERAALAENAEHDRLLTILGLHAVILAPLVARDRTLGILVLGLSAPGRTFTTEDLRLVRELTQRAALALDNANLYAQARAAEAALCAANADLQERMLAQTADVQVTTERLRAAIEGNLDAVYFLCALHNAQGEVIDFVVTDVNERALQALQMTRDDLIGQQLCELLPINRTAGFFEKYVQVYQSGITLEEEFPLDTERYPDSWVHHQVVPTPEGVVISSRDATASRRARERLRESEALFRSAFDHTIIGMALVGIDGAWLRANQTLCAMLGYDVDAFYTRTEPELTYPADRLFDAQQFALLRSGAQTSIQYEKRYIHADGHVVRAQLSAACVPDANGQPHYYVVQIMDVSERHAAEQALRELNVRLSQSNRELQEFASVASHDLQEPLRKIQAFGDRLRTRYRNELAGEGLDYLERMLLAAQRLQRLISDLLAFAQVSSRGMPFAQVNLRVLLQEVISDLESQIERTGGRIAVGALPTISADPTQMRQLFQNLISNSLKFSRPAIPPVIQIAAAALGSAEDPTAYCISVIDNGIGFDEKYLDRIFTVFQRLHARSAYEGTGIGLAICRRIIERHNGTLTATSTPDQGTTFFITLPVRQEGGTV